LSGQLAVRNILEQVILVVVVVVVSKLATFHTVNHDFTKISIKNWTPFLVFIRGSDSAMGREETWKTDRNASVDVD